MMLPNRLKRIADCILCVREPDEDSTMYRLSLMTGFCASDSCADDLCAHGVHARTIEELEDRTLGRLRRCVCSMCAGVRRTPSFGV
ncbi:hypothetical protein [Bifidobacterium choloepi]|uniref:Uncharacterized protein n=1 Tax=Bifidobacterium choloepi TaxID=2614131 RepID=A0A6I5MXD2_9BIFI|nr:hypothetical protein [Bifidobacterium choloepi]NEG69228.1 hypothetical protein [Bifidobacterium choloepi]